MRSNFSRELEATLDETLDRIVEALRTEDYWVISRIDPNPYLAHPTDANPTGEDSVARTVVLRCLPRMNKLTLPLAGLGNLRGCTVILRELGNGKISVRLEKPSHLLEDSDPAVARQLLLTRQKLSRILIRFDSLRS